MIALNLLHTLLPLSCLIHFCACSFVQDLSEELQGWRRKWSGREQCHLFRVVTMAPINIQMVAIGSLLVIFYVFYLTLRCDLPGKKCLLYVLQHRKSPWTLIGISRISWLVLRIISRRKMKLGGRRTMKRTSGREPQRDSISYALLTWGIYLINGLS